MRRILLSCPALGLLVAALGSPLVATEVPPLVTAVRAAVATELSDAALPLPVTLPVADVEADYDPATGILTGRMTMALRHEYGRDLAAIGFALYANNERSYKGAGIEITTASVDGRAVEPRLVDEGRGVLLPAAYPDRTWVQCELGFVTTIPAGQGRAGLLARMPGAHNLYNWLPEPAVWQDGWHFPALSWMSDPSLVRLADYRCRFRLPEAWTVVASGAERHLGDGAWEILAPRTRNCTLWLSDRPVEILTVATDAHRVRVAFTGKRTIKAAFCASIARDTLQIASQAFGPYPRRSYDIVFTPFTEMVGGMEASGMTFINSALLELLDRREPDPLQGGGSQVLHAIIHEVVHSWWYDQVGNDTHAAPWLDEPLTEWSTWFVMERLRNRAVFEQQALQALGALSMLPIEFVPTTTPGDRLEEMQFGLLLYYRAPLLYEVLRARAGEAALLGALREWYASRSGTVVDRQAWERTFLPLLPEADRKAFLTSWLDGVEDPIPAGLASFLPPATVDSQRATLERAQALRREQAAAAAAAAAEEKNAADAVESAGDGQDNDGSATVGSGKDAAAAGETTVP